MKKEYFLFLFVLSTVIGRLSVGAEEITIRGSETVMLPSTLTEGVIPYSIATKNGVLLAKAKSEKVEKGLFKSAVKAAIIELADSISGTCAKEISATLHIDAKGSWEIVEIGIGGSLEVKVGNPKPLHGCSK